MQAMSDDARAIVQGFLDAIGKGEPLDPLATPDMKAWTVSAGDTPREKFFGGCQLLSVIFNGSLRYQIDALTVQDDRAVAEVSSHGTLMNGDAYKNNHAFIFKIRDGLIASVAEYMNMQTVSEKIVPLMQEVMGKQAN
jgi:ketosteroid isomerase-like protein